MKIHTNLDLDKLRIPAADQRLQMIEYAASRIKAAGFIFAFSSMQSEACYYGLPGYKGVLRIAIHRQSRREAATFCRPPMASIVFPETFMPRSKEQIDAMIERAVGRYIMAHANGTEIDPNEKPTS